MYFDVGECGRGEGDIFSFILMYNVIFGIVSFVRNVECIY